MSHKINEAVTLEDRLNRTLETGEPLRLTLPSGLRVRVIRVNGFLRALTVRTQQRDAELIIEADNAADVARELSAL